MINLNRREFMHASAASFLLNGVTGIAAHGSPAQSDETAKAFVHSSADGKGWTVGNKLVEREIRFDARLGLYTQSWRHKVTGTDFMGAPLRRGFKGEEFSFLADKDSFAGASESAWEFIEAKTENLTPSGQLLAIHLRSKSRPVEVTAFYAVYDAHPVVRKWIAITNRSKERLTISHLKFESVAITPGPAGVLQAAAFFGTLPRELFVTGRIDDPAVLERNSLTGEGFIAMNEAPGWTRRTELVGWGEGVQLMYDTDLFPLERSLESGETFTAAKSSIAFFVDGKGFADPRWVMPTYAGQVLLKKGPSYQPPWIYNTWEPFERGITKSITLDLIAAASKMGLDVFTIDDGWQSDYAENAINRQLFPDGLDEIQAAVELKGMRLGLWVPLAAVSTNSAVYREHPEWICKGRNGDPKFTGTMAGAQAVMCLATQRAVTVRSQCRPADMSWIIEIYNLRPQRNAGQLTARRSHVPLGSSTCAAEG